jgi:ribosomal protein S13
MAIRIVGVDLPQNKRGEIALTYIYGIGRSSSAKILDKAGVIMEKMKIQLKTINNHQKMQDQKKRMQK